MIPTARLGIGAALIVFVAAMIIGRSHVGAFLALYAARHRRILLLARRELIYGLAAADGDDDPFDEPSPFEGEEPRPHVERIGPIRRWWRERREAKLRRLLQVEREEESRPTNFWRASICKECTRSVSKNGPSASA